MDLTELRGIGPKTRDVFERAGVHDVMDLLFWFPRDFETFGTPELIGEIGYRTFATLRGVFVQGVFERRVKKLVITQADFSDEAGGKIRVVWFNAPFMKQKVQPGVPYVIKGRVSRKYGVLQLDQPKVYTLEEYERLEGTMQPVYPVPKGISNAGILRAVRQAFDTEEFARIDEDEMIPLEIRRENGLCSRCFAVRNLHFPQSREDYAEAARRMAFEEIFLFLYMMKRSGAGKRPETSIVIAPSGKTGEFLSRLPFRLTGAQLRVISELQKDLQSGFVTNRLIQGDVGSGKTIVALSALMDTAFAGYQGALMAPTEVLAEQHYQTICELFQSLNVPLHAALLTGSMTALEKKVVYDALQEGKIDIIVGTHALIQEKVRFRNLALAVTDEQHRFGTAQRRALAEKSAGDAVHVVVMSATPIPRTLALILYGDMDISVIDELPSNRRPIKNAVVDESYHDNAYRFITKQIQMGHQAYIICPMVEYSEGLDAANVEDYAKMLEDVMDPSIRIGKLTGPMPPAKKKEVMQKFSQGTIDILVSTTVVEVGVDVKNATVMMVEDANRFGLAALHQLRGRVGRSDAQSYCIFVSDNKSPEAMQRLQILGKSNNGFEIAEKDLQMRGPGDLAGIRQSGALSFTHFDPFRDAQIAAFASKAAEEVLSGSVRADERELQALERICQKKQESIIL